MSWSSAQGYRGRQLRQADLRRKSRQPGIGRGQSAIHFIKGDICDAAAVEAAMAGCEAVVHFAAESHVDRSIYEPAPVIETNVTGTFVLLQVARKLASSDSCTSPPMKCTATWRRARSPTRTRRCSRAALTPLRKPARTCWSDPTFAPTDFPAVITRSSNNYGPSSFRKNFCRLMITNALDGKPLPIYGDGKQQRDWLHVEDNCRGVLAVLERGRIGEVYNIGGARRGREPHHGAACCFA